MGVMYESEDFPFPSHKWKHPQIDFDRLVYVDFLRSPEYIVVSDYSLRGVKYALESGYLNDKYEDPAGRIRLTYWRARPSPRIFEFVDQFYFSESSPYRLVKEFRTLYEGNPSLEFPSPTISIFRRKAGTSDLVAELIDDSRPIIRSDFDVYLIENRLIYVKEECVQEDVDAKFFLHLVPADVYDLPDHRKQYGFDNLDFSFDRSGLRESGICWATVALPEYGITEVRTGQYKPVEGGFDNVWKGRFDLAEPAGDGQAAP